MVLVGFAIALLVMTRASDRPVASNHAAAPAPQRPRAPAPPLIVAPDAGVDPARVEREQLLAKVRDPRQGHEAWNERGIALLQQLGASAIATTEVGCYMAGCVAVFTFASQGAYEGARDRLVALPEYRAWTGGKTFTTPEQRGDGSVVVAVVFERPD